ncbi:uncharacterized protein LOC135497293 [Lineus longissimus]|uniref:uncharacterized protein LOC135497293 n=1 Tax=Lineus longissimus TaxID=88925 RepID=UPI002B4E3C0F
MITPNIDPIPLPPKRRWSAISENIARGTCTETLGCNRPASANDAGISERDAIMWNRHFENGEDYQQQKDKSMTKSHSSPEGNSPQAEKTDQKAGNYAQVRASDIEPHVDNSSCLCYPELWRAVGFDPLGLGHKGLFTLRIYHKLGGRDFSEFQRLFAKIRDFYHQLQSYPVTPGIVYIPSDRREVNTDTISMIVNTNLKHLEYYAYHGRYAPRPPSLQDKLTPLPHTLFNIDSSYYQGQHTWSKAKNTSECLPAQSWGDNGQCGYQKPMQSNLGITQYQQYPRQYQFNSKASDLGNETVWENHYQDINIQSPNTPHRIPPSPKVHELKRRGSELPLVPRMWPSHVVEDGKRRKVEGSKRTLPDVQETDISHLNQGTQRYPFWMGKQSQGTPPFTTNDRDAQTSCDDMPPLIYIPEQASVLASARAWTTQEILSQKQSQHYWPPPGLQMTSDQDVSWVKQELLGDTDQALDLSVCNTANCRGEGVCTTARHVMTETNGADYQQRPNDTGEFFAGNSKVYSLRNVVDKHILQQFPDNTVSDHVPSIKRNSEVETTIPNGNRKYPSRKGAPWDRGLGLQQSFQNPTVPNNQQVSPTIHSKTVQPANCSVKTSTLEQHSSSCENGLVGNKNVTKYLLNGGPSLSRSQGVHLQTGLAQPCHTNQGERVALMKDKTVVQKEQKKPRKMEVPDMKVVSEVHSTLCHMLAGLVGYPLSLVTNMGLEDHSDQSESKTTTTKRMSKMGAKILSQFLAEGTDCYDKVVDLINDQYDVSDEEVVKPKHAEDDRGTNQRKLLRSMRHDLSLRERPEASPKYIPNGTSDILARMLSGYKCYSTELQNFSARNPKLDTDRDSEGESTYSCGSECSGCDSCRGQTRGDESWETSFNVLPGVPLRQSGNPGIESHIKTTERCAVLKRHPLHSYSMPLPARKRHIFMLQEDENFSWTDHHNHNHFSKKKDVVIEDPTPTQIQDGNSVYQSNRLLITRDSNEGLTAVGSTDKQSTLDGNEAIEQSISNSTCSADLKAFPLDTDLNRSSVVTDFTDLTNDPFSIGSPPQEGEPGSLKSHMLDLPYARRRKVSLAINSIPNELLNC